MIRPIDIQEKEFTRGVRGYKEEEVNEFLDEITIDLERLLDELRATKEENSRLVEELERHRSTQGTVLETLEAAGINVAYFEVNDFQDYLEVLRICTDITGRKDLYEKIYN